MIDIQGFNVIIVFDEAEENMLMCKRLKDPYIGLSNLVGGKIEQNESGLDAAYRELFEETSISKADIILNHLMDFTYYHQDCYVEVYVGKLNGNVSVQGDENKLYWSDLNHDFFDMKSYAGEGNIGHMLEQIKMSRDTLFAE
jgi:8-oxo-dGTP diphosphatase